MLRNKLFWTIAALIFVKREDVAAKHLITNELVDKKFVAKIWW